MKRSMINSYIEEAIRFIESQNFALPPFAYWSYDEWQQKDDTVREIVDVNLGWDITDFGSGDFEKTGLLLFTLRNGHRTDSNYTKPYAEKILVVRPGQVTPTHFHWNKMEDIINRGGGRIKMKLFASTKDGSLSKQPFLVTMDGQKRSCAPGETVTLDKGQSITLTPDCYHTFWADEEHGFVLAGEVSKVNDDHEDNRFYEPVGRFPSIEEDEKPIHLLAQDYRRLLPRFS